MHPSNAVIRQPLFIYKDASRRVSSHKHVRSTLDMFFLFLERMFLSAAYVQEVLRPWRLARRDL